MKQIIIILVLSLGMCSINVSAQTKKPVRKTNTQMKAKAKLIPKDSREYQVEDDGFEWYKVCKNGKYGAESRDGKLIIPTEYEYVYYHSETSNSFYRYPAYFKVGLGGSMGAYSVLGKCIIPITRHYTGISIRSDKEFGTYYMYQSSDGAGICNARGQQLVHFKDVLWVFPTINNDIFYYELQVKGGYYGIGDNTGKVIVKPQPGIYSILPINGKFVSNSVQLADVTSLKSTVNPFVDNHEEEKIISPSNSSKSDNNFGNNTTTVVVEHHRDPIPVQEWVQCTACWGSTVCPHCAGSGTTYIGNNLHRCSRCGGRKICTSCSGKGGSYITVYK